MVAPMYSVWFQRWVCAFSNKNEPIENRINETGFQLAPIKNEVDELLMASLSPRA